MSAKHPALDWLWSHSSKNVSWEKQLVQLMTQTAAQVVFLETTSPLCAEVLCSVCTSCFIRQNIVHERWKVETSTINHFYCSTEVSLQWNWRFFPVIVWVQKSGITRDFPCGLVVRTLCFRCMGHRFCPWSGELPPCAPQHSPKTLKQGRTASALGATVPESPGGFPACSFLNVTLTSWILSKGLGDLRPVGHT